MQRQPRNQARGAGIWKKKNPLEMRVEAGGGSAGPSNREAHPISPCLLPLPRRGGGVSAIPPLPLSPLPCLPSRLLSLKNTHRQKSIHQMSLQIY